MTARRSRWVELAQDLFALACMLAGFTALTLWGVGLTAPPA